MALIDFHTHPWLPAHLNQATSDFIRSISPAVATHGERLSDPAYAADVLRDQGVDRAVVLPEHCRETSGDVRTDTVLDHCAARPDFYIPFASVNPNLDDAPADLLRRYIQRGARGLKLYPSYQFFHPDERRVYPIYQACLDAGIPLLLHIGSSVIPGTRVEFCDPARLAPVARDFPDLPIVMAHGGRGHWYDECAALVRDHENVYIDVTGLVPGRLLHLFPGLADMADRVVFGSDWPAMPKSVAHNVDVIRGLGLPDTALRAILGGNAQRLLRDQGPGSESALRIGDAER
ncbi:MAG TPA: amidohydrolase family protein [Longimicrobiales bacterium]|nr:amidohydrolase family protein [Longimicrobiales bacterium]